MCKTPIRLVHETLSKTSEKLPNKVALICDGRRLSYSQINAMANRMANALYSSGLRRGDRVVLFLPNSVELVVSAFAVLKANGVFSVVDYGAKLKKVRYITAECQANALVTLAQQTRLAGHLMRDVPSLQFAVLAGQDACPDIKRGSKLLAFEDILKEYPPIPPVQETIDCDLAYLIYTSGSTGEPKGVMITHRSSLFAIQIDIEYIGLTTNDVIIDVLPLSFGYGFHQMLKSFRVGGTLVLERSFAYPTIILKRIEAESVTGFPAMPTILAILVQMNLSRYNLSSLRFFSSMGAPLAPNLIQQIRQKLPHVTLFSMYSQTEACNALGLDPAQLDLRPSSVGKALPGTEVWLVDEKDQRIGAGKVGELVVRGGHVRCGYWNKPHLAAGRFRPGPLPGELVCYTGDMFRMDKEGFFYFVGRSDEIINTGGRKVAPKEIEDALHDLDGILEAAAIGVPDPILGQVVKAFVVLDKRVQPRLTEDAILQHCHQSLEYFMIPRQIEVMDTLPKTTSGKIEKAKLA